MNIEDRAKEVVNRFTQIEDWEDRYREIIKFGKSLPNLDESLKVEDYKVKGCQSQVWLVPEFKEGLVHFKADSDAAIVKGIISIILEVYSSSTPNEILTFRPTFIEEIGLKQHLSMSRANGLSSMIKKVTIYAMAFMAKANMSK